MEPSGSEALCTKCGTRRIADPVTGLCRVCSKVGGHKKNLYRDDATSDVFMHRSEGYRMQWWRDFQDGNV